MPTVSIVVPVYNAAPFLHQCLDSLLGQTFRDFELLCVDDGSTDNSMKILEEYAQKDGCIRVFSRQNDGRGAAEARNLGLGHAAGKYVQFLDSDDFFDLDMVERLVAKAEETSADVVVCGAVCFDHRRQRATVPISTIQLQYAPKKKVFSYRDCPGHIFQMANNVTWNKLYRKSLLDAHGLRFEAIPISDDQYVPCLALVLAERLAVVNEMFIKYRINIGTSQVDMYHKHPASGYAASCSIVKKMRELGVYEDVKQSYLNMELSLMREYFDRMQDCRTLRFLYGQYRGEVLGMLGAENLPEGYFYDPRLEAWYRMLLGSTLEEILFASSRAYGSKWLTGILRFAVPYERIAPGSRVVLVGRGIVGRYWHAQLLLSDYCDVAAWVEDEGEIPPQLAYDAVLVAK